MTSVVLLHLVSLPLNKFLTNYLIGRKDNSVTKSPGQICAFYCVSPPYLICPGRLKALISGTSCYSSSSDKVRLIFGKFLGITTLERSSIGL